MKTRTKNRPCSPNCGNLRNLPETSSHLLGIVAGEGSSIDHNEDQEASPAQPSICGDILVLQQMWGSLSVNILCPHHICSLVFKSLERCYVLIMIIMMWEKPISVRQPAKYLVARHYRLPVRYAFRSRSAYHGHRTPEVDTYSLYSHSMPGICSGWDCPV